MPPGALVIRAAGRFFAFCSAAGWQNPQRNERDFGILAGNVKSKAKIFKAALPNGYIGVKP